MNRLSVERDTEILIDNKLAKLKELFKPKTVQ